MQHDIVKCESAIVIYVPSFIYVLSRYCRRTEMTDMQFPQRETLKARWPICISYRNTGNLGNQANHTNVFDEINLKFVYVGLILNVLLLNVCDHNLSVPTNCPNKPQYQLSPKSVRRSRAVPCRQRDGQQ